MPYQTFYNLPAEKKEQIITATLEELNEKGFERTSIAKIIEKARIPRGSFYQYFEDKEDLYRFIIIEVVGERKNSFSNHFIQHMDELSFSEVLRQLFISGIVFYRECPLLARAAANFLTINDRRLKKRILGESEEASRAYFNELINERKNRGELDPAIDNEVLIYLIHSLNQSLVDYFMDESHENFQDEKLIHVVDKLMAILENGIRHGSAV